MQGTGRAKKQPKKRRRAWQCKAGIRGIQSEHLNQDVAAAFAFHRSFGETPQLVFRRAALLPLDGLDEVALLWATAKCKAVHHGC